MRKIHRSFTATEGENFTNSGDIRAVAVGLQIWKMKEVESDDVMQRVNQILKSVSTIPRDADGPE